MRIGLAAITAFLVVMAWQYRKNKAALFVVAATLFASAAVFAAGRAGIAEWIVRSLAIAWLICMLVAGVLAAIKLARSVRKKMRQS